jgi:hypothetical protein
MIFHDQDIIHEISFYILNTYFILILSFNFYILFIFDNIGIYR